jgi:sterol desaturase/sphingolipid hydroxylase (fatty acid hydroxylase superfamily)
MEAVFADLAALWGTVLYVFGSLIYSLHRVVPVLLVVALLFAGLSYFMPCNGNKPWWTKKGLGVDVLYWLGMPLFTRYMRIGLTIVVTYHLLGVTDPKAMDALYTTGRGVLGGMPLWVQAIIFIVVGDFLLYWMHRGFHNVALWKYHAIHHSSEEVEWTSAARFHPVNLLLGTVGVDVIFLVGGMTPSVFLLVGPLTTFYSAFVHANLNWTMGPLKHVLSGPVFHRWHHTSADAGGNKNFGGFFSFWDWMFGTFYMPKGVLPENYGVDDGSVPEDFALQLVYPFLPPPKPAVQN